MLFYKVSTFTPTCQASALLITVEPSDGQTPVGRFWQSGVGEQSSIKYRVAPVRTLKLYGVVRGEVHHPIYLFCYKLIAW